MPKVWYPLEQAGFPVGSGAAVWPVAVRTEILGFLKLDPRVPLVSEGIAVVAGQDSSCLWLQGFLIIEPYPLAVLTVIQSYT